VRDLSVGGGLVRCGGGGRWRTGTRHFCISAGVAKLCPRSGCQYCPPSYQRGRSGGRLGRRYDVAQVSAYGIGLFQRLHVLDALAAELKAAQDGLAREETNRASYIDQLGQTVRARRGTALCSTRPCAHRPQARRPHSCEQSTWSGPHHQHRPGRRGSCLRISRGSFARSSAEWDRGAALAVSLFPAHSAHTGGPLCV
jgi:hypothetical protein